MIQGLFALVLSTFALSHNASAATKSVTPFTTKDYVAQLEKTKTLAPDRRAAKVFEIYWNDRLREAPELASQLGHREFMTEWSQISWAAIQRRKEKDLALLGFLQKSLPIGQLKRDNQVSHKVLFALLTASSTNELPSEFLTLNQMYGLHSMIISNLDQQPKATVEDFRMLSVRIGKVPMLIEDAITILELASSKGITTPSILKEKVVNQLAKLTKPENHPVLAMYSKLPSQFSPEEKKSLESEGQRLVQEVLVPAFKRLHDYADKTYFPKARTTVGLGDIPNGKRIYAHAAREQTTTDLSIDAIHELGLKHVQLLRDEMMNIAKEAKFQGDFAAWCKFLNSDPQFKAKSPEALIDGYLMLGKRVDPEIPKLFGHLPRTPYGVLPIPDFKAEGSSTAYYERGSLELGRAGYFYANTTNLNGRPTWEMETLLLHEAVPGHHLQLAIAQEKDDIPEFRKSAFFTAYIEGWALYAESLGPDLGFFKDPYSKAGNNVYNAWRAIRLVVDTGLHAKGWSVEEATKYFLANTCRSEAVVKAEIQRYLVMPAQALSYKIGEIEIRQLREQSKKELGPSFNVRDFHDFVLSQGALPLSILSDEVAVWIKRVKKSKAAAAL